MTYGGHCCPAARAATLDAVPPIVSATPSHPDFAAIRAEFGLPDGFPPDVLAAAERAASVTGVASGRTKRHDATDLELVTIDPPGAKDLDQAVGVQRTPTGYRVHYAIADLGVVVRPGGALDAEVRRRGQRIYLPDGAVPLHPPVLSEAVASLLPDGPRPAVLWRIDLDSDAEPVTVELHRAAALRRGAIELELPEQEVRVDGAGGWTVVVRRRREVEAWNAEISLLTGMCAAQLMLAAGVGILRTLPAADPGGGVRDARRSAAARRALAAGCDRGRVLAGVDRGTPDGMALLRAASRLLRGAGYEAFDGAPPTRTEHAAIGAPYAHVTAPLRRLVDRFGTEVCLAVSAGAEVPAWVREALPSLTGTMAASDSLAASVHRSCVDRTEATVLAPRVGERFQVVVLRAARIPGTAEPSITDRQPRGTSRSRLRSPRAAARSPRVTGRTCGWWTPTPPPGECTSTPPDSPTGATGTDRSPRPARPGCPARRRHARRRGS